MHVEVISTEDLGDRSYLVHDGTSAVVVDPQRDVDRVEKVLADLGVRCAMVVETHIHNDYVTGGYDLAMRNGCPYVVNAADDVSFARLAVERRRRTHRRGDDHPGNGHPGTHGHPSVLRDLRRRRDSRGVHRRLAVVRQRRADRPRRRRPHRGTDSRTIPFGASSRRRASRRHPGLPDPRVRQLLLLGVGHAAATAAPSVRRRRRNDALTTDDEDAFVDTLIANLTAYPGVLRAHGRPEPQWSHRTGPLTPDSAGSRATPHPHRRRGMGRGPARQHRLRHLPRATAASALPLANSSRPTSGG